MDEVSLDSEFFAIDASNILLNIHIWSLRSGQKPVLPQVIGLQVLSFEQPSTAELVAHAYMVREYHLPIFSDVSGFLDVSNCSGILSTVLALSQL